MSQGATAPKGKIERVFARLFSPRKTGEFTDLESVQAAVDRFQGRGEEERLARACEELGQLLEDGQ